MKESIIIKKTIIFIYCSLKEIAEQRKRRTQRKTATLNKKSKMGVRRGKVKRKGKKKKRQRLIPEVLHLHFSRGPVG